MATRNTVLEAELEPSVESSHRKPKSPSGVPLSQISPKIFPLPMSESFNHWWKQKTPLKVQDELLSTLPFYPEPSATHSSEVISFKSPNSLVFPDINEFHVKPRNETVGEENAKHLVIIHGYGAGLGFFEKTSKAWHRNIRNGTYMPSTSRVTVAPLELTSRIRSLMRTTRLSKSSLPYHSGIGLLHAGLARRTLWPLRIQWGVTFPSCCR